MSENVNTLSGVEFEKLCHILLEKMNFDVTDTKTSGDGGIDLIAHNHQPLLSGKYIIQCKRYVGGVGEPVIRDLFGVVMSERANKGILITTGYFTKQAVSFANGKPLELIDGDKLDELIALYLNDTNISTNKQRMSSVQTLEYDSNFMPLVTESPFNQLNLKTYLQLTYNLAYEPESLTHIGHIIEFLQYYVFNISRQELSNVITDEEFNKNKFDAIVNTILAAEKFKSMPLLYPEYLSIVAQNYFLLGCWNISLEYYEKMLRLPGVLFDVDYSRSYYTGELEVAAKIIHNMCIIYVCMNETGKAKDTMKRYKYVFDLEFQRTLRLMRNNPQLQNRFEEESERLNDVFDKKWFYFDLRVCELFFSGESILSAIYSDAKRNNESCEIDLGDGDEYRIIKKDYTTIEIEQVDVLGEHTLLEASYRPNKSIKFYDISK